MSSPSNTAIEVAVIGAGISGAAVAASLARAGWRVRVFDSQEPGSATAASGAMLGALGEVVPAEDQEAFELRLAAATRHPHWLAEIGSPARTGTFVLASARRATDMAAVTAIEAAARRQAIRCEVVDPKDVPGLSPAVDWPPGRVVFLPDEGWVDAPQLVERLLEYAVRQHGATAVHDGVARIEHDRSRVTGVSTISGERIACGEVVLCAGTSTHRLLERSELERDLLPEMLPAKGVGLLLRSTDSSAATMGFTHVLRTPNRELACGLHVVPRTESDVYVGASNRVSRFPRLLGTTTAAEVVALLGDALREISSCLSSWDLQRTVYGYRPLHLDGRPSAGRTAFPGLSVVTGAYRNGVLLAPLLADALTEELTSGRPPDARLTPMREVTLAEPSRVLVDGLVELSARLGDRSDPEWGGRLEMLLGVLAGAPPWDLDGAANSQMRELLARYPRREMVPEAVIELLQARGLG